MLDQITKKEAQEMTERKIPEPLKEKYAGKGTKARINTMAEKHFFNSRSSK